jgi:hypothetical protein
VDGGKFPQAAALVQGLTAQGLYVKAAASKAAATETGTLYIIEDETTPKKVVMTIKGSDGKVVTATQAPKGDPKIG